MKLFLLQIRTKKKHRVMDVVVHARTKRTAEAHLKARYAGHELLRSIELPNDALKHFVVGEYED